MRRRGNGRVLEVIILYPNTRSVNTSAFSVRSVQAMHNDGPNIKAQRQLGR